MTQPLPHTTASLTRDLRALGLATGDVVLLHSSASSIGYIAGGLQAIVQAFLDVLGPGGTLVVPTHTPDNSDPATWTRPPVPEAWWQVIRDDSPGFDPARTPSRWMGVLPEVVRTWPGALRSGHPQVSFAAVGALAAELTAAHDLGADLGEDSPLGAIYRAHGKVLLLGCGYRSNTSLHLAETRQDQVPQAQFGASVRSEHSTSRWVRWTGPDTDSSDFAELGTAFDATGIPVIGPVAGATARLMPQRDLVDFATGWMRSHRRL
ncbi:aminoglycoside N(3)-acetyltransferase [Actinoplanes sp. TFC3]|uniref:aminoglycoside N(3)-acetyltransferase n=1 Tax=Actinoplanes sp. TFC3 TaxID=1710355 RepID=UPI000833C063|nr:AAC(3) family N-acetyltransferase [Actinoplanes sp. TFC3]